MPGNSLIPSVSEATRGMILLDNAVIGNVNEIEVSPFQPRIEFPREELEQLGESIREKGQDYPILVRPIVPKQVNGVWIRFQIVDGERRWRSVQIIERPQIKMLVQALTDREAQEKAFDANVLAQSFSDYEEAVALKKLWVMYEDGGDEMSLRKMARRRNISVDFVRNRLAIVGWTDQYGTRSGYHPDVQAMLQRNRKVLSSAALINPLPVERREKYIELVDGGGSYKDVEKAIKTDDAEIERKRKATEAPDTQTGRRGRAETEQRGSLGASGLSGGGSGGSGSAHSGSSGGGSRAGSGFSGGYRAGGGMSRGLELGGTTRREALSEFSRAIKSAEAYLPYLAKRDVEELALRFAKRLIAIAEFDPEENSE